MASTARFTAAACSMFWQLMATPNVSVSSSFPYSATSAGMSGSRRDSANSAIRRESGV